MKIRHKLLAGLIGIAALFSILFYISINQQQRMAEELILESSATGAAQILNQLGRNLSGVIEDLQIFSGSTEVTMAIEASNAQFSRMTDRERHIKTVDREWTDKKETPFISGIIDNSLSRHLSRFLSDSRKRHGNSLFSEVFLTNRYGVVIAASGRTSDYYQGDEEWYRSALSDKGFWAGDVEYDESSQSYSCPLVVNLYDRNGNFAGIMKASMKLIDIASIINYAHQNKSHASDVFKLITRGGRVIYSTGNDYNPMEIYEGWPLISEKREEAGYLRIKSEDADGKTKIISYVRSANYIHFSDINWTLVVEHDLDEIVAPVIGMKRFLWISTSIIAISTIIIGYLIARSISNSLRYLIDATNEIGRGRLDTRVAVRSRDEIGELSEHFNRMVDDLQKISVSNDRLNREIEERNRLAKELKELATTDRLTGAYNRLKFDEVIGIEIARARRNNEPLSLIIMDVDDFKKLNDTYGHLVGDRVLISLSKQIMERKREYDYFFRWGGEEFLLITPETGLEEARILAERIRSSVAERIFDQSLRVTISLGVAELHQDEEIDDCIKRADDALYMVKTTGKNRVEAQANK